MASISDEHTDVVCASEIDTGLDVLLLRRHNDILRKVSKRASPVRVCGRDASIVCPVRPEFRDWMIYARKVVVSNSAPIDSDLLQNSSIVNFC